MSAVAATGFTWPRWAPTTAGAALAEATGGDDGRFTSVPGRIPTRVLSPWQSVQPSAATSARVFMCAPAGMIWPPGLTVVGWQPLQEAAVLPVTGGWPVGGMPWQEVQVIRVVSVHSIVVVAPETPLKLNPPWQ